MGASTDLRHTFPVGAFRRIGWAFLFLGISVGPTFLLGQDQLVLDLLPDFVGFLMIATAANRLIPFSGRACEVRNLALLLAFLAIPTIVQYRVVTPQAENVTTSTSPLWPLSIVQGLLELVLVWKLCGLVADFARRAGDVGMVQRARSAQVVYLVLKVTLTVGLLLIIFLQNPALILAGVIAGVTIGIVLLVVMMRLMWRAERMCAAMQEIDLPEAGERKRSVGFLAATMAIGLLAVGLMVAGYDYYSTWKESRAEEYRRTGSSEYFTPARTAFYGHLDAGEHDQAYLETTAAFKARISRDQFEDRVRRYKEYRKVRENRQLGSGARTSSRGDSLQESEYVETEKGKVIEVTVTIRGDRDSIFLRTPPPIKVDDFVIEEKVVPQQGWHPRP